MLALHDTPHDAPLATTSNDAFAKPMGQHPRLGATRAGRYRRSSAISR
jgi:hypothetical protein